MLTTKKRVPSADIELVYLKTDKLKYDKQKSEILMISHFHKFELPENLSLLTNVLYDTITLGVKQSIYLLYILIPNNDGLFLLKLLTNKKQLDLCYLYLIKPSVIPINGKKSLIS